MALSEREIRARLEFIERIRRRLRDYPELNRLIEGKEFSSSDIEEAMVEALQEYNSSPPLLGEFQVVDFPNPRTLLAGTIAFLIKDRLPAISRNDIQYQAGSLSIAMPQFNTYSALADSYYREFKAGVVTTKNAINTERAVSKATMISSQLGDVNSSSPY